MGIASTVSGWFGGGNKGSSPSPSKPSTPAPSAPARQGPLQPGTEFTSGGGTQSTGTGMSIDLGKATSNPVITYRGGGGDSGSTGSVTSNGGGQTTTTSAIQGPLKPGTEFTSSGGTKPISKSSLPYSGSTVQAAPAFGVLQQTPMSSSFGGALGQSIISFGGSWNPSNWKPGNLFNVKTIGNEGFIAYERNIFKPLIYETSIVKKPNLSPSTTGRKETIITNPQLSPYQDTSKLSPGVQQVISDIGLGIAPKFAGLPERAASVTIGEDVSKGIQTKYQAGIDIGEIKYSTPEEQKIVLEQAQKDFTAEYGKQLTSFGSKRSSSIEQYYTQLEQFPGKAIKFGVETAALSFAGETSLGKGLIDIGTLRVGTTESLLSKQNVRELIGDLSKQSFKISGKELFKSPQGSLFDINAERSIGSAKQNIKFKMGSFETGKPDIFGTLESGSKVLLEKGTKGQSFAITKGKTETKVYDIISDSTIDLSNKFGGGGKITQFSENYKLVSKGFGISSEGVQAGIGSGYIKLEGATGFKPFRFMGLTKETPEAYNLIGAKPTKLISGFDTLKVRGTVSQFGSIQKLPEIQSEGASVIFGRGPSTTTPSTFQLPQVKGIAPQGITSSVEKIGQVSLETQPSKFIVKAPKSELITMTKQSSGLNNKVLSSLSFKSMTSTLQSQPTIQVPSFGTSSFNFESQKPVVGTISLNAPVLTTATKLGTFAPTFNAPFALPFKFSGNIEMPGQGRKIKGKQRKKYTPDYLSILTGKRGRAKKGPFSGLESRPIPKGFTFAFKAPKGFKI